jgi:peptidoglycan/xylan/chitin deacetylase (PgdA/CDA1 family)
VRSGRLDFHSYRLFFGVQTMEYQRGARQARSKHASDRVVALGYHAIGDLSDDRVLAKRSVPRERFAEQLDGLARRGWSFVDLEAVLQALDGKRRLPRRAALVTFDDAYADLLDEGIPVLAERGIPAVVFAVAGKVGGTNDWDRHLGAGVLELLDAKGLLAVARNGIEIGSHAMTHRVLPSVPPDELDDELRGSADALEALGIARPRVLAYPYGEWSPEVAEGARAAGYSVAFTITPGVVRPGVHRYLLPRVEVFAFDTPRILRLKVATAGWREHWRKRVLRWLRAQR